MLERGRLPLPDRADEAVLLQDGPETRLLDRGEELRLLEPEGAGVPPGGPRGASISSGGASPAQPAYQRPAAPSSLAGAESDYRPTAPSETWCVFSRSRRRVMGPTTSRR